MKFPDFSDLEEFFFPDFSLTCGNHVTVRMTIAITILKSIINNLPRSAVYLKRTHNTLDLGWTEEENMKTCEYFNKSCFQNFHNIMMKDTEKC